MASIIKTSINLNMIPKGKIIEGKKGKYLPITITLNDAIDIKHNKEVFKQLQQRQPLKTTCLFNYLLCVLIGGVM